MALSRCAYVFENGFNGIQQIKEHDRSVLLTDEQLLLAYTLLRAAETMSDPPYSQWKAEWTVGFMVEWLRKTSTFHRIYFQHWCNGLISLRATDTSPTKVEAYGRWESWPSARAARKTNTATSCGQLMLSMTTVQVEWEPAAYCNQSQRSVDNISFSDLEVRDVLQSEGRGMSKHDLAHARAWIAYEVDPQS